MPTRLTGPSGLGPLLERYDVFFLDIYGVLVRSDGALPCAAAFLDRLTREGKRFLLLSNDASRSPETAQRRYARFGLPIAIDQVITSGMLLAEHFAAAGLRGRRCIVLGTKDSEAYAEQAGGVIAAPDDDSAEVLICADDYGFDFLPVMNQVVSVLLRRIDRGLATHLVLPNPDLVYPMHEWGFGLTAGAMAAMIEAILTLRDPGRTLRFVPLGKPAAPMFEAALRQSPTQDRRRVVMIGDQIVTDIRGARDFGIDSVLVESGVGRAGDADRFDVQPTWIWPSVAG
jgi:HAD superfamily hydrolase (TIGR01459 family)